MGHIRESVDPSWLFASKTLIGWIDPKADKNQSQQNNIFSASFRRTVPHKNSFPIKSMILMEETTQVIVPNLGESKSE